MNGSFSNRLIQMCPGRLGRGANDIPEWARPLFDSDFARLPARRLTQSQRQVPVQGQDRGLSWRNGQSLKQSIEQGLRFRVRERNPRAMASRLTVSGNECRSEGFDSQLATDNQR